MVSTLFADVTPLLEAISASDERRVIAEVLDLLATHKVQPTKLAGRVGLAALWGGADPHAVSSLAATGRIAEWIRGIPAGPEPGADDRRILAPALPLVQGFLAVARWVGAGINERPETLPEATLPADVKHPDGPLGGLREAFAQGDVRTAQSILLGYNASGTDYRTLVASILGVLAYRYPEDGHPVVFARAGERILDMADWGGNMPAFIAWFTPLMMEKGADAPAAAAARAYGSAKEHDLSWVRARVSIPQEEAAGAGFHRTVLTGDATAACDAVFAALKAGATPRGVAAGLTLAAATSLNAVPEGDHAGLLRAAHTLLYTHAVDTSLQQVQDTHVWPVLYTAAAAVQALGAPRAGAALESAASRAPVSTSGGGLMPASMLRSMQAQLSGGDAAMALATAHRYVQMGHPSRALAGALGTAAAMRDTTSDAPESLHAMPFVAAAAESYQNLPATLQGDGKNALLTAAIRLASELRGAHAVADRVDMAIDERLTTRA